MIANAINLILGFLSCSVDDLQPIPSNIDKMDWEEMYTFAKHQAITAIFFRGIERLKKENTVIPRKLLFNWIGDTEQIKHRNLLVNMRAVSLIKQLQNDGFECCVLKGQGNAAMYPNPLCRTPGDIDVWVRTKSDGRCNKDEVIKYAKKQDPKAEVRIYHVEYEWKGVPVELHFMPGIMNNPFYNRRLQRWYDEMSNGRCFMTEVELPDGIGKIPVPTKEFNVVFQLAHMMHHFFDEGIGLRQFVDYYFVLCAKHNQQVVHDSRFMVNDSQRTIKETLKYLGLWKFAGAVMYVMREVFALDEANMIAPVDERRGKTLMKEILKGGNFGRHSGLTNHSTGGKYFAKTWRNMKLVREYPAEALCEPFFRTWHFFWRMRNN